MLQPLTSLDSQPGYTSAPILAQIRECMLEKKKTSFFSFLSMIQISFATCCFHIQRSRETGSVPVLLWRFFFFLSLTLKHIPFNFLISSLSLLYADAWCDVPSLCSAAGSGAGLQLSVGVWLVAVSGVHGAFIRKLADDWRTPLTRTLKSRLIQHCLNNSTVWVHLISPLNVFISADFFPSLSIVFLYVTG